MAKQQKNRSQKTAASTKAKAKTKAASTIELPIAAFRKACDDLIGKLNDALKEGVDTNAALKRIGAAKEFAGKLQAQVDKRLARLNSAAEREAKKAEREAKKAEREEAKKAKKADRIKKAKDRFHSLRDQMKDLGLSDAEITAMLKK